MKIYSDFVTFPESSSLEGDSTSSSRSLSIVPLKSVAKMDKRVNRKGDHYLPDPGSRSTPVELSESQLQSVLAAPKSVSSGTSKSVSFCSSFSLTISSSFFSICSSTRLRDNYFL